MIDEAMRVIVVPDLDTPENRIRLAEQRRRREEEQIVLFLSHQLFDDDAS